MRTIEEILRLSPEERRAEYQAIDIDKVIIDGNEFINYGEYSFLWEKTYVKSPVRATGNGAINNLNSYSTFLTAHLKINFSLMSIDTYRRFMQLLYSKNEFSVSCYDVVYNRTVENIKMYFATEEMPKLWTIATMLQSGNSVELLGVQNYTVEMVGTNVESGTISVVYHTNPLFGTDITASGDEYSRGTDFIIRNFNENENFVLPSGYVFSSWNTKPDGSGVTYLAGNVYYGINDLVLYAQYTSTATRTLTFNYGLGEPQKNNNLQDITSIDIVYDETYGTAISRANITLSNGTRLSDFPNSSNPSVVYLGETYYPYTAKGWFTTSTIGSINGEEQRALRLTDKYKINGNGTIYQIFTPKQYTITFDVKGGYSVNSITDDYGKTITAPTPRKDGQVFDGWYIDENYTTRFNNQVPPKNITVYAKWGSGGIIPV